MKTDKNSGRFITLARRGVIESTNEAGNYCIQRIDDPESFAVEAGLDFIPPLLHDDIEAEHVFDMIASGDTLRGEISKGEWAWSKHHSGHYSVWSDIGEIAEVYAAEESVYGEDEANARAIAEVPTLIRTMRELLGVLDEQLNDDCKRNSNIRDAFNDCSDVIMQLTGYKYELIAD